MPNKSSIPDRQHDQLVCVGQFAGSHGVRGLVKLRSFTGDPAAIIGYGPLVDERGERRFAVTLQGMIKDQFLVRVEGISTREQAQALNGLKLHVDRRVMPEPEDEDEFYHADLIGLRLELGDGTRFGTVRAVHDFGAGDLLEISTVSGNVEMLPFTRACVPVVDVRNGRLVIDLPNVIEARGDVGDDGGEVEITASSDDVEGEVGP